MPEVDLTQRVNRFPMRIELVERGRAPKETQELLDLARERAVDPSVFDSSPPFFWRAVVTNDRLDSYGTRQMPSSLANYAADLNEGIAFLASHAWQTLPMGSSLRGRHVQKKAPNPERTWGDFFTIPDLNLNGINTNDFIRGVQARIIQDVSKGFHGGFWRCTLCGGEQRNRFQCPHYLLEEYPEGPNGDMRVCHAEVEDSHISEVSAVFDGAVPGAAIEKAMQGIEAGEVPVEKARSLALRYRVQLPGCEHVFPGFTPRIDTALHLENLIDSIKRDYHREPGKAPDDNGKDPPMGENANRAPEPPTDPGVLAGYWRAIESAFRETGFQPSDGKEPATVLRDMASEITELRTQRDKVVELEGRVKDLEPQAADGRAYRSAKVEETWGEYVRAGLADGVNEEEQKALWGRAPIAQVVKECDHYRKLGDARFPGGRQTGEDEAPPPPETNGPRTVPLAAYRA